jgi:RNA-binding protein
MLQITSKERRALRASAHKLEPVVIVGAGGLSEPVLAEIERSLAAHELIKVRAAEAGREEREAMMALVCEKTGCAPVQTIGKMLILYRPAPKEEAKPKPAKRPARKASGRAKRTAVTPERRDARTARARPARKGTRTARR